jgi:putative transposase
MSNTRNRTPSEYIGYGLYLYFLGMSFRNVAKALSFLHVVKRSHVAIWNWIQKYKPEIIKRKRKRIDEFIIDETQIKVGSEHLWLWIVIEPKTRAILHTKISKGEKYVCCRTFVAGHS